MKNNLTTAITDGLTPSVDLALGIFDAIPGMSPIVGALKLYDDIKNRIFVAKLQSFAEGLGDKSPEQIKEMADKLSDPGDAQRLVETMVLVLDSYNELYACELLGKLFLAYLEGRLTNPMFRRLATAIDGVFADDLQRFVSGNEGGRVEMRYAEFMRYLEAPGFCVGQDQQPRLGTIGPREYSITELGQLLRNAVVPSR